MNEPKLLTVAMDAAVQKLSPMTTLPQREHTNNNLPTGISKETRRDEIRAIVIEVEASKDKKEKLSPEQRAVITSDLFNTEWTIEEIRRRGEAVKRTNTFQSVGFEWWFNAEMVYSEAEAYAKVNKIADGKIEARKLAFIKLHEEYSQKEILEMLEREGLIEFQYMAERKVRELKERLGRTTGQRIAKARRFILKSDDKTKEILYQAYLMKNPKEEFDKLYKQYLHILAPHLLNEVEEMME